MDTSFFLIFLIVSFGLIIVPGPNVLVIVSTSIAHGTKRGLQTVAGTSFAMAIQLFVVAEGTVWFVRMISDGIYYLKWIGVTYLLYLGIVHLKAAVNPESKEKAVYTTATFSRGFLVSLTNPKTLLFFSAFIPQFVSASGNYRFQIFFISVSFLTLAIVLDSCYALLASRLTHLFKRQNLNTLQNGLCGIIFLGVSIWLAFPKRVS